MNFTHLFGLLAACILAAAPAAFAQGAAGPARAVAPAAQQANASAAAATTVRATFACDAGKTVAAVFTNGAPSSVALVLSDGRKLALPQALSGSGARYANADDSFVFWNKGHTAFIEENGKPTYSGCTAPR